MYGGGGGGLVPWGKNGPEKGASLLFDTSKSAQLISFVNLIPDGKCLPEYQSNMLVTNDFNNNK